jgi:hypothetical protein
MLGVHAAQGNNLSENTLNFKRLGELEHHVGYFAKPGEKLCESKDTQYNEVSLISLQNALPYYYLSI